MRRIRVLSIILLGLLFYPLQGRTVLAGAAGKEMPLNPDGFAYEVHPDAQGNLWVSEYDLGELWRVDAGGGAYTVYKVGGNPGDARPDNSGGVWWVDGTFLHRLNIADRTTQAWQVTGSGALYGLAIDSQGRVWAADTDPSLPNLYSFTEGNRQACTYPLPDGGQGYYPAADGTKIWLGDTVNGRLLRLGYGQTVIDWWQLPPGSSPQDVIVDASGNAWYADPNLGQIGRLAPGTSQLTTYPLPVGSQPNMLAAADGKIWYTEILQSSAGLLDPSVATGSTQSADTASPTVTPTCTTLPEASPGAAAASPGTQDWSPVDYATLINANGWTIYQLPTGAFPWGITVTDSVYLVDSTHRVLANFPPPAQPKLTVTKVVQNTHGGTKTASDFTLYVGATQVASGAQTSFKSGNYIVSEGALPAGYQQLSIGGDCASNGSITLVPGDVKSCTITNHDVAAHLKLVKSVNNAQGGTAQPEAWTLQASGPTSISGAGGVESDVNAGVYTLSESSGPAGYTAGDWVCTGGSQNGSQVTLALGQSATCTITNTFVPHQDSYKAYLPWIRR